MARRQDPMAAWKARMQPTKTAETNFRTIRAILEKYISDTVISQTQAFPPKYVLTVSAQIPRRRGQIFATVAAVAESVYFDLMPSDAALHRTLRKLFSGRDYMIGEGFELAGDLMRQMPQVEALVKAACADLTGKAIARKNLPTKTLSGRIVPPIKTWSSATAWSGPGAEPVRQLKQLGGDTVFAQCTVVVNLGRSKGLGVKHISEREAKGLLEFEPTSRRAKDSAPRIVAAHWRGFDRRAWSFRLLRQGKREFMPLFVGDTFEEQQEASAELLEHWPMDRIELIAAIPWNDGTIPKRTLGESFEILPDDEDEESAGEV